MTFGWGHNSIRHPKYCGIHIHNVRDTVTKSTRKNFGLNLNTLCDDDMSDEKTDIEIVIDAKSFNKRARNILSALKVSLKNPLPLLGFGILVSFLSFLVQSTRVPVFQRTVSHNDELDFVWTHGILLYSLKYETDYLRCLWFSRHRIRARETICFRVQT